MLYFSHSSANFPFLFSPSSKDFSDENFSLTSFIGLDGGIEDSMDKVVWSEQLLILILFIRLLMKERVNWIGHDTARSWDKISL